MVKCQRVGSASRQTDKNHEDNNFLSKNTLTKGPESFTKATQATSICRGTKHELNICTNEITVSNFPSTCQNLTFILLINKVHVDWFIKKLLRLKLDNQDEKNKRKFCGLRDFLSFFVTRKTKKNPKTFS